MGWLAFIGLAVVFSAGVFAAFLPLILLVVAEESRETERKRNSTGGRNYVE